MAKKKEMSEAAKRCGSVAVSIIHTKKPKKK